ncbi:MAG TPA: hypothetical protein VED01_19425 [Burkholderiales bacterium]|nr:hypothetical protein [Burkholderiales bacterium]
MTPEGGASRLAVHRYDANGALDPSFSVDGWDTIPIQLQTEAQAVALQADGRIVIAGWTSDGADSDFALVRYQSDGTLDRTFGPPINTLGAVASFTSGGAPVVLDPDVYVSDDELAGQGHYSGASVALSRHGGASADDVFHASGELGVLTPGASLVYGGLDVGTVTANSGGLLVLTFNSNATEAKVNGVLQSIAYSNASAISAPIQIDWTFSDGNSGAQGDGGALAATGSTTVAVNGNDAPTFVLGGSVSTDVGGFNHASGVIVQPNGRIIVGGYTHGGEQDFSVVRYDEHGHLDPTFSGDGRATASLNIFEEAHAVALQADGKIVLAGHTSASDGQGFVLVRFNPDGTLDSTFSVDGFAAMRFESVPTASEILVQPDGKLIAVGSRDFAVARFNSDGSLDTTFDGDGKITTPLGVMNVVSGAVLLPDGKLIVAGGVTVDFVGTGDAALVRYNTDGSLDTTFGTGATLVFDIFGPSGDRVEAVDVQPDGKIVLATASGSGFAVVRLNSDGTFDSTFDGDGVVVTNGAPGTPSDIVVQPDGKILVSGRGSGDFVVVRYNADGTLDTSFHEDGIVTFGDAWEDVSAALQADGKIVVTGNTSTGLFSTTRLNADGIIDASFGTASDSLSGTVLFVENGVPVVLDSDVGVFDPELLASGNYAGASLRLERHGGANAHDAFSATGLLATLTAGESLQYDGLDVGSVVTNSSGTLLITFNANATQLRVERVLRSLAYSNTSEAPPASVEIDWTFSDGNAGSQGYGGPLATTGTKKVFIEARTDSYLWSSLANGTAIVEFDPSRDQLVFDDAAISAPAVGIASAAGSTTFTHAGKSVTLPIGLTSVTAFNVSFANGSALLIGDNSTLQNDDGDNSLFAGFGAARADHLIGLAGNDMLNGGAGPDRLDGGPGTDLAHYASGSGLVVSLLDSSMNTGDAMGDTYVSIEGALGSQFDDVLIGDGHSNLMRGSFGNDYLVGHAGADTLEGGFDDDRLEGGPAGDVLNGGPNTDSAVYYYAAAPVTADLMSPGLNTGDAAGDEYLSIENLIGTIAHGDLLFGNTGVNSLVGLGGDDSLFGRGGADQLLGMEGNDVLDGGAGPDNLRGDAGFDVASYSTAPAAVMGNLAAPALNSGDATGDTFSSIEGVIGSSFHDTLVGDNALNLLRGLGGNDYLQAAAGADTLLGETGNDRLEGGLGGDMLDGGIGADHAAYYYALSGVHADLLTPASNTGDAAGDSYAGIEGLIGTISYADVLSGDDAANEIVGLGGADNLNGRGGADNLQGGDGDDELDGGAGTDRLHGGAGNDDFRFTAGQAHGDAVTDFAAGDHLFFHGYGPGATFTQTASNVWTISYSGGLERIAFTNTPAIAAGDYSFA